MTASLLADLLLTTLTLGLAVALTRAVHRHAPRPARALALTLAGWLAATAGLAAAGALAVWTPLPRVMPIAALAVVSAQLALRRGWARAALAATPLAWLVGVQAFRVGVELALYLLHVGGRAPAQITFAGRNFDIVVGATAPALAWAIARGRAAPRLIVAWNAAGLVILLSTIAVVATSVPGPLRRDWGGAPFTALASFPVIWLPAVLAPAAIALHVAAIRAALAQRAPAAARRLAGAPT